jgi:hypothetical protein
MKKCLVIAACLAFVLLSGCNRCGMWDWYEPCDLVEGRAERLCRPCPPCKPSTPGQPVYCSPCVDVGTEIIVAPKASMDPLPEPVIIEEVVEEGAK